MRRALLPPSPLPGAERHPVPVPHGAPRRPRGPAFHLGAVTAVVLLVAAAALARDGRDRPALAQVVHSLGYQATVLGWTSWYGSYGLGDLGDGWCIDHGTHAPDAEYGYVPTQIDAETDGDAQAAMAWAATMYPPVTRLDAAAGMLVQHDLRNAVYPFGALDVDAIGPQHLAGFGGDEAAVLERARAVKADALAHAHLRAPFTLTLVASPAPPGVEAPLWATLTDAFGQPVVGATVHVTASTAPLVSGNELPTGPDGTATFRIRAVDGPNTFAAAGFAPDTRPRLYGPTALPAQRIIQGWLLRADGTTEFGNWPPPAPPPPPPTTTTTTLPPTTTTTSTTPSTTVPPSTTSSTSTSTTTTTTTVPPSTSTTAPPTTTTTLPPRTTPPETPPAAPPGPPGPPAPPTGASPPARPSLPVTGRPVLPLVLFGAGLLLLGLAAVRTASGLRGANDVAPRAR